MASKQSRAEQLNADVIACIEAGINVTLAISNHLNRDRSAITSCLRRLEVAGKIHHVRVKARVVGGYNNIWALGQYEGDSSEPIESRHGDRAVIKITTTYPVVGERDPLVAALFGAPKQSPHRCTACGVEQGGQHQRGCIVALVAA